MQNLLKISKQTNIAQQLTKAHFSAYYNLLTQKSNQTVASNVLSSFQPEKLIPEEIDIDEDNNDILVKDDNQIDSTDDNGEENYLNLAICDPTQVINDAIKQNDKLELLDDFKDEAKKTLYKQMKYCLNKALHLIDEYKKPLILGTVTAVAAVGIYKTIEYIVAQKQLEEINQLQGVNQNFQQEMKKLKGENLLIKQQNHLIKKQNKNIMATLKKKDNELLKLTEENEKKNLTEVENTTKIEQLQQQFNLILTQINPNIK